MKAIGFLALLIVVGAGVYLAYRFGGEQPYNPLKSSRRYMALGLFEDAELSILKALSLEPDRIDLKFRLFEIYYLSSDRKKFEKAGLEYSDQLRGTNEWRRIQELATDLCPKSETFG